MKLHFGATRHVMRVITEVDGYWFIHADGARTFVRKPGRIEHAVRKLYGVSTRRWFLGAMAIARSTATNVEPAAPPIATPSAPTKNPNEAVIDMADAQVRLNLELHNRCEKLRRALDDITRLVRQPRSPAELHEIAQGIASAALARDGEQVPP